MNPENSKKIEQETKERWPIVSFLSELPTIQKNMTGITAAYNHNM